MIKYAALTNRGIDRSENQDRIAVAGCIIETGGIEGETLDSLLAVVCDGVGGEASGARAATLVGEAFTSIDDEMRPVLSIFNQIERAEQSIRSEAEEHPELSRMASTIAGVYIDKGEYIAFNVGDSRVYIADGDGISTLSDDHTRAQAMVDARLARSVDELPPSAGSTLVRYLSSNAGRGVPAVRAGQTGEQPVRMVICSDGAYRKLGSGSLRAALEGENSLLERCKALRTEAVEAGSGDDISVILVEAD
jgi:PPM family protein phosphatase